MDIIPCAHELCAADQHLGAIPGMVWHYRATSDEGEPYRVRATWAETDKGVTSTRVEMTHGGETVILHPSDAIVWARVLVTGVAFGHTASLAVALGTAIEVLSLLDADSRPSEFGSMFLARAVDRAVARIFGELDDDEEPLYVTATPRSDR